jgi:hypothetical protein
VSPGDEYDIELKTWEVEWCEDREKMNVKDRLRKRRQRMRCSRKVECGENEK